MSSVKSTAPDHITEEYYQIGAAILASFPKYRPPLNLFQFREDLARLQPLFRRGERLSNEQVDEVQDLCAKGNLFVSRSDKDIYSRHIAKQLDLVLVDSNLKMGEIADICISALGQKTDDFFVQPLQAAFDALFQDVLVFTELLWQDKHRIKTFMRRLQTTRSLTAHSLNTLFIGIWLLLETEHDVTRRTLDRAALGFLLHDLGMTKVPAFILDKKTPLTREERDKITMHPLASVKIMQRLDVAFNELNQAQMEHHERLDGSGYPQGFSETHISKIGRITAVADSFSAMIRERPHAKAMEPTAAAAKLVQESAKYDARYTHPLQSALMLRQFETT